MQNFNNELKIESSDEEIFDLYSVASINSEINQDYPDFYSVDSNYEEERNLFCLECGIYFNNNIGIPYKNCNHIICTNCNIHLWCEINENNFCLKFPKPIFPKIFNYLFEKKKGKMEEYDLINKIFIRNFYLLYKFYIRNENENINNIIHYIINFQNYSKKENEIESEINNYKTETINYWLYNNNKINYFFTTNNKIKIFEKEIVDIYNKNIIIKNKFKYEYNLWNKLLENEKEIHMKNIICSICNF